MNVYLLSPDERMMEWKKFRETLKEFTEIEQLEKVAVWFGQWPTERYLLEWDNPDEWPTPWEILYEGDMCQTTIAYLMSQTLILSGWDTNRLQLSYIDNKKEQLQVMVLIVDNKHVLNYSIYELYDLDKIWNETRFLINYRFVDGKYIKIK